MLIEFYWPFVTQAQLRAIMTDISKLQADVAALQTGVAAAGTALADLAAKVAALSVGGVTEAQIDALASGVETATAALAASVTANDPPTP